MAEGSGEISDRILLKIESANWTYLDTDENSVEALRDIRLSVRHGEFISIIGPSGYGKMTLLRLVVSLDFPESGKIILKGEPVTGPSPDWGYAFQRGSLFPWLTITQSTASGLKARNTYQACEEEVPQFTKLIELNGFERAYPHQIFGGMVQRVAIARALINHPTVLLLDEPMGVLDAFTGADLQDKLLEFWKNDEATIILVIHDVNEVLYLSNQIIIATPRPGKTSEMLEAPLPRPRSRNSYDFATMHGSVLKKLHLTSAAPQPGYTT